ncbi:MAG: hypothetical protein K9M45_05295 [Kiritimatiellales bacterium]|nr:hypothetical protein [Kiritimatiellales bacterium]
MKRMILAVLIGCLAGCAKQNESCSFPKVSPEHTHMQALLENAMGYINPDHGLIDEASGYPVEGWNHDPEKGLFLRSFTQLTSIGEWTELLANIAAGYADNPYISRFQALEKLGKVADSLLADQADPAVSAKGLLGNFLGLENGRRLGPLGEEIEKSKLVEAFGAEKAEAIWRALLEKEWFTLQRGETEGRIKRSDKYGTEHFTGPLEPFADDATKTKIMELMDGRVVKAVFGDNVNLSSSIAKAVGALLHPDIKDDPKAIALREKLERFIAGQREGFHYLFDKETDTFIFGWDATKDRFAGWDDGRGKWVVGHQNYFINEFRGPFTFALLRHDLPINSVKNSGFKIKPYRMQDGTDRYTLATWSGSAFQSLGLTMFMQELEIPGWKMNLENTVDIELDFAARKGNPGFLTESYSGNEMEYTGDVGIPDIAVTGAERIADAPSLYTLGVSYMIAPEKIEAFLAANWGNITKLFTDHGPWEGYKTSEQRAIEFQTSAHTMSLILGGIGTGTENMKRYLKFQGLENKLAAFNKPGEAVNFLDESVKLIAWTSAGDELVPYRNGNLFQIRGEKVRTGGITVVLPQKEGVSLSNGILKIRYRAADPVKKAVITLKRAPGLPIKPMVFENEIHTRFDVALGHENSIEIPMPATPGLENIKELIIVYGDDNTAVPVDLTITEFEFIPGIGK